jgi:hypothetical protein
MGKTVDMSAAYRQLGVSPSSRWVSYIAVYDPENFVCVWLLFCWFAFFFVWFLRHSDGYLTCVLVLCQFNFCSPPSMKMDNVTALINELTDMQHAI